MGRGTSLYRLIITEDMQVKRKKVSVLAIALGLLASCATNESYMPETVEIGFNAVTGNATKAILSAGALPQTESFDIWGFYSNDGSFNEFADNSTSNFMDGLKIEWTSGNDASRPEAWRNKDKYYYWPTTGVIGFYAIYPSGLSGVQAPEFKGNGLVVENYKLDVTSKYTDLMYAYTLGTNRSTALPIQFKHALSQIEFALKLEENYPDVEFYIDEIQLLNVDLQATFKYVQPSSMGSWIDNTDCQIENILYSDDKKSLSATASTYSTAMVMIPQELSKADNAKTSISISYRMIQADGTVMTGQLVKDISTLQKSWDLSTKYVYTLNFNLNEITFNPEVTDWTEISVNRIQVP